MIKTKNVYLDNIYNFCLEHLKKFCILAEIKSKNHDFYGVLWFHHENRLVANFHYHIRNQRVKIHKHSDFQINRRYYLCGTSPVNSF